MGIHGLTTFFSGSNGDNIDSSMKEFIPYGSHLVTDGPGFLFHLLNSPEGLKINRQFGGSYLEFDSIIRNAYYDLVRMGFSLSVYFDGSSTLMKAATLKKRSSSRENEWLEMYNAVLGDDSNLDQKNLVLPPLSKQQFIYTLIALGVPLIFCDHEADQPIALACKEGNWQSIRQHYCYGADR
jgi:hypothetical protein